MDRLTKEQRYKNMSANKGKGTKLELLFGKLLWNAGVRYRKNDKTVFGKPDFVIIPNSVQLEIRREVIILFYLLSPGLKELMQLEL